MVVAAEQPADLEVAIVGFKAHSNSRADKAYVTFFEERKTLISFERARSEKNHASLMLFSVYGRAQGHALSA